MGITLKRAIKILKYIVYDYWLHESDEQGYSNLPTAEDEIEACKFALDFIEGYEQRLKADKLAMLNELQLEIEELDSRAGYSGDGMPTFSTDYIRKKKVNELIQQKINALKAESEE